MIDWIDYKEDCCVVVPVYKENPVFFEQASLMQCVRVLGQKYDICLVAPFGLNLSGYISLCPGFKFRVKRLNKEFFNGTKTYNQLCKRHEFYSAFSEYLYMLVYQLDCWIFSDNLEYFISLDYDYIGAPWFELDPEKKNMEPTKCGNGGFSLRKIDKFLEVCEKYKEEADDENIAEDVFFSSKSEVKVSPVNVGMEFSFEVGPNRLFKMNNNKLPMGCHKPYLFDFKTFWKDYLKF